LVGDRIWGGGKVVGKMEELGRGGGVTWNYREVQEGIGFSVVTCYLWYDYEL